MTAIKAHFRTCVAPRATQGLHPPACGWPGSRTGAALAIAEGMFLIEDVMTKDVVTLEPDDDLALTETIMGLGRIRHLPVATPDGVLVGLITHRDLLRVFADQGRAAGRPVRAKDVMRTDVVTTSARASLARGLKTMMHNKFGCLVVVDAANVIQGIVTEFDLVKFAARMTHDLDEIDRLAQG